jgi:predicted permease
MWAFMPETLIQDLRYSLRQLRRRPGFTVVAILTLALGMGATTAVFSVLDPLLLRKLPVQRPNELVRIDAAGSLGNAGAWEAFAVERFSKPNAAFSGIMAFVPAVLDDVAHDGRAGTAHGEMVSQNYFSVLGVKPYAGRLTVSKPELGNVVVLSFAYWQHEFSEAKTVLGRNIQIQGKPYTIIGITPPEFFGMRVGEAADVYLPFSPGRAPAGSNAPSLDWVMLIGRLAPGTSAPQATSALQATFQQIRSESSIPSVEQRQVMDHLVITSAAQGLSSLRHRFSLPARILMCVVGLVLLIACSNVANLLLAQASARQREFTVRLALGARRSRLVRQLVTESAVLAATGALAGLLLAQWTSRLLVAALSDAHRHVTLTSGINSRVLLFSLATTVIAVLLSGLAPALFAAKIDINQQIKTHSSDNRGAQARMGGLLVSGQVAMSVTALVAGGLLLHSLMNLETMPVGFDREHILALDMNGNASGHTAQQVENFYDRLLEQASALPGVQSATLSSFAPVSGRVLGVNLRVPGYTAQSGEELKAFLNGVRPGYFSTLGIELLQGRDFTRQDSQLSLHVVVINRSLADHYFPNQNPIGKRLQFVEGGREMEIIGVVADSKYLDLREPSTDFVYFNSTQAHTSDPIIESTLSVRAAGNLNSLRIALPELIRSLDASVRVTWVATLGERIDNSLNAERLIAFLSGIIGFLALALTCIGLYGVLSFRVGRSTIEIGIRMALGAQRGQIFRLFIGRGMRLVLAGFIVGLVAALASAAFIKSFLYGVGRGDPVTIVGICVLLTAFAFAACFLPAHRAMRVEPLVALRDE